MTAPASSDSVSGEVAIFPCQKLGGHDVVTARCALALHSQGMRGSVTRALGRFARTNSPTRIGLASNRAPMMMD